MGLVLSVLALGLVPRQDVTVVPTKKMDEMQSFVMAETFKYLYLLFSPNEAGMLNGEWESASLS